MNVGIYQGASAIDSLERWQAVISQNIASASVPGYKKTELSIQGLDYGTIQDRANGRGSSQPAVMPADKLSVSFANGEMKRTGNPTDVAIGGKGFFELQQDDGSSLYTRSGEFSINTKGQLTSSTGQIVQGSGGPITLQPNGESVSIDATGQVFQGTQLAGKLKIVEFADNSKLQKVSGGFMAGSGESPTPVTNPNTLQGYLEGSNVSAIDEMVRLIEVSHAQEANQKVISSYDSRLGRVIQTFTT
jgi:flagellar basal body rod protein FlgG